MRIHTATLKRGISRTPEFEKKGLASYSVSAIQKSWAHKNHTGSISVCWDRSGAASDPGCCPSLISPNSMHL
jgi:hypothetical protein